MINHTQSTYTHLITITHLFSHYTGIRYYLLLYFNWYDMSTWDLCLIQIVRHSLLQSLSKTDGQFVKTLNKTLQCTYCTPTEFASTMHLLFGFEK